MLSTFLVDYQLTDDEIAALKVRIHAALGTLHPSHSLILQHMRIIRALFSLTKLLQW